MTGLPNLPFLERFRKPIEDGTKTWTGRTRKYGNPGDRFLAFRGPGEMVVRIVKVFRMTLGEVATFHYEKEGCASPEDFIEVWAGLHPNRGYDPDQRVWVHEFAREI